MCTKCTLRNFGSVWAFWWIHIVCLIGNMKRGSPSQIFRYPSGFLVSVKLPNIEQWSSKWSESFHTCESLLKIGRFVRTIAVIICEHENCNDCINNSAHLSSYHSIKRCKFLISSSHFKISIDSDVRCNEKQWLLPKVCYVSFAAVKKYSRVFSVFICAQKFTLLAVATHEGGRISC